MAVQQKVAIRTKPAAINLSSMYGGGLLQVDTFTVEQYSPNQITLHYSKVQAPAPNIHTVAVAVLPQTCCWWMPGWPASAAGPPVVTEPPACLMPAQAADPSGPHSHDATCRTRAGASAADTKGSGMPVAKQMVSEHTCIKPTNTCTPCNLVCQGPRWEMRCCNSQNPPLILPGGNRSMVWVTAHGSSQSM
jgi:hypothetical protein